MSELTITVKIAERPYRLKVTREEEEVVRMAADFINDKTKEYANQYAFNDRQDLLAMTAMHFAIKSLNGDQSFTSTVEEISEKVKKIDGILSEHIS
jgi:cell division protein ZapA